MAYPTRHFHSVEATIRCDNALWAPGEHRHGHASGYDVVYSIRRDHRRCNGHEYAVKGWGKSLQKNTCKIHCRAARRCWSAYERLIRACEYVHYRAIYAPTKSQQGLIGTIRCFLYKLQNTYKGFLVAARVYMPQRRLTVTLCVVRSKAVLTRLCN